MWVEISQVQLVVILALSAECLRRLWYDSYLSITAAEKGGEILLLTRTLIALLVTGIWISSTYQVVMQMNNEYYYAQQSSEQQNSYWWNDPYNSSDGERKLIRLQRAYNRLVDRYEMAKFEEMSNFVHTNAFMVCYLFSLVSGLSGWILLAQRIDDRMIEPVLKSMISGRENLTSCIKHCYVFLVTDRKIWIIFVMAMGASILWCWLFNLQWTVLYDNPHDVLGIPRQFSAGRTSTPSLEQIHEAYRNKASQIRSSGTHDQ